MKVLFGLANRVRHLPEVFQSTVKWKGAWFQSRRYEELYMSYLTLLKQLIGIIRYFLSLVVTERFRV